uniref:Uncharacterized protein n=1 Tax=Anguilla anguilla TaxID=7936 RepID=A0A0E9VII7_ANGAN
MCCQLRPGLDWFKHIIQHRTCASGHT